MSTAAASGSELIAARLRAEREEHARAEDIRCERIRARLARGGLQSLEEIAVALSHAGELVCGRPILDPWLRRLGVLEERGLVVRDGERWRIADQPDPEPTRAPNAPVEDDVVFDEEQILGALARAGRLLSLGDLLAELGRPAEGNTTLYNQVRARVYRLVEAGTIAATGEGSGRRYSLPVHPPQAASRPTESPLRDRLQLAAYLLECGVAAADVERAIAILGPVDRAAVLAELEQVPVERLIVVAASTRTGVAG